MLFTRWGKPGGDIKTPLTSVLKMVEPYLMCRIAFFSLYFSVYIYHVEKLSEYYFNFYLSSSAILILSDCIPNINPPPFVIYFNLYVSLMFLFFKIISQFVFIYASSFKYANQKT